MKFHELSRTRQVIVAVCAVVALVSVGILVFTFGAWQARERQDAFWSMRLGQAEDAARVEIAALEQALVEARAGEPDPAAAAKRESLAARLDLIPVRASLGGTMRYFPDEMRFCGIDLAYAYAEDGHNAVEMLLRYSGEPENYQWQLLAYDDGGGWRMMN